MSISRIIYKLGLLNQEIEFLSILVWVLFYPQKESFFYFFIFAIIIIFFSLKNIIFIRNIGLSYFSYFLLGANFVLIISIFFSNYHLKSILLFLDIFLISIYFILFFLDEKKEDRYFCLISYVISLFSFLLLINYVLSVFKKKNIFFTNPILQGVISGIGVLILFYYLLKKFNWIFLLLLILNIAGVFISGSKAAFIAIIIFSVLLSILKKKKLIPFVVIFIILTFIIPNPIKKMFFFSLKKDPYAFERINIWKMSVNIIKDNFLTGVGLENFSEVSKRYNFRQKKGPANYFKVPLKSHNDYLKILAETGIFGLIVLIVLLYFILRNFFSSSLFNISKILLLYILFQAFLFNIIFHISFFFILIFLFKILLKGELTFKSFNLNLKLLCSFFLVFIFIIGYLLPYISDILIEKSRKSKNFIKAFDLLKKSEYLNPLDMNIYYFKSLLLFNFFKKTSNLESFYFTLKNIKKVQRLNEHFVKSYLLEVDLYISLLKKNLKYVSLEDEIILPLLKAEKFDPHNVFIKLKKAEVYLEFDKRDFARQEALKALKLEPEFVSALYFLQKNFNYFENDKKFDSRINIILKKAKRLNRGPGTYLYSLYKIPENVKK